MRQVTTRRVRLYLRVVLIGTDPEKSKRVMAAMLKMKKLDIAALTRAFEGRSAA